MKSLRTTASVRNISISRARGHVSLFSRESSKKKTEIELIDSFFFAVVVPTAQNAAAAAAVPDAPPRPVARARERPERVSHDAACA